MNPVYHAESSVRKWSGRPEDYIEIHCWMDASKEHFGDFRHRAMRHHSQGIFEAERVFGKSITNSEGRVVPVRAIAERHVLEDCGGFLPTLKDWLRQLRREAWMSKGYKITDDVAR